MLKRLFQRQNASPDQLLGVDQARYVVFDTELTGLDRKQDTVVSIGAIRMKGRQILLGETFYTLVNPQRDLTHDNVRIHHIVPSELVNQPLIESALQQFLRFVGDDILVGHFVHIDIAMLENALGRKLPNRQVDTARYYDWLERNRRQFLGAPNTGPIDTVLFDIANKLHISLSGAHNALVDAYLTAQVWQRLLIDLPDFGIARVKDLRQ
jgi:DNA polymerase-3 subunit epsilon